MIFVMMYTLPQPIKGEGDLSCRGEPILKYFSRLLPLCTFFVRAIAGWREARVKRFHASIKGYFLFSSICNYYFFISYFVSLFHAKYV